MIPCDRTDRVCSCPTRGPGASAEAGLTLIETLFALALLTFGVLALFAPMHYANVSFADSRARAAAIEIATSRMESVKIDPQSFFDRVPEADRPLAPLVGLWHHAALDQDFGEIAQYPEYSSYVLLVENLAVNNTAIVRIPVIWLRAGGRPSTTDGLPFEPNNPDAHPAQVELRAVVRYR
jgi:hypothetical protein